MLSVMHAKYLAVVVLVLFTKSTLCLHINQDGLNEFKVSPGEPAPLDVSINEEDEQDKLGTIVDVGDETKEGRVKRQAQVKGYQHLYPQLPSAPPYNPYQPQSDYNPSGQYNGLLSQTNTQTPQQWNSNVYNPSQPGYPQLYNPNQGPYNTTGHNQYGGSPYGPTNGPYPNYSHNQTNINPPGPYNTTSHNQYGSSPYGPTNGPYPNYSHNQTNINPPGPYNTTSHNQYGSSPYGPTNGPYPNYSHNQTNISPPFSTGNRPNNTFNQYTTPRSPYGNNVYNNSRPSQSNSQTWYPRGINNSFTQRPLYGNSSTQWGSGLIHPNNQGAVNLSDNHLNPHTGFYTKNVTYQHHGQNDTFIFDPNNGFTLKNHSYVYKPTPPSPYNNNNQQYPNQYLNQYPNQHPQTNYNG